MRAHSAGLAASLLALVVCLFPAPGLAQRRPESWAGMRLEAALEAMQAQGLRIVFSSQLVTPDMRVLVEPRARALRAKLDEIVEPHGLRADDGPGRIVLVVRAAAPLARDRPAEVLDEPVAPRLDPAFHTIREHVRVTATASGFAGPGSGSDLTATAAELVAGASVFADDPARVAQAWPRVGGGDEFRSDLAVRGSPYRHSALVIDGIATSWLQHAASARGDTGTLSMIGTGVVGRAALRVGAYPRTHAERLGAELTLDVREGSRTAPGFRLDVGGTNAAAIGEGPIGRSERGSWIVAVRKSYVEWPVGRSDHGHTVFGFADAQAKLVYDAAPGQQLGVTIIAGRSSVERDTLDAFGFGDGATQASMVSVGWRSAIGGQAAVTQRAALITRAYRNLDASGAVASRGADRALVYRTDFARTVRDSVVEAGGEVRRTESTSRGASVSSSTHSGFVSLQWTPADRLVIGTGARAAGSTMADRPVLDRWVLGEWGFGRGWSVHGSAGVSHQFPDIEQAGAPPAGLRAERALHAELGFGRRLPGGFRWDATVYARRERDVLRALGVQPVENALTGSAAGVELLAERPRETGLSGWIAYSYGRADYVDVLRGERFSADFDQRHGFNASARYRLSGGTTVGLTFRTGSNVPIPGYVSRRDGELVAGPYRNTTRLPPYARLDLRAEHPIVTGRSRVTAIVEVLNVLNRGNVGPADGWIDPSTGRVVGFTERLFPRLVTAGLRVVF